MTGTDKQIQWAEKIKAKALDHFAQVAANYERGAHDQFNADGSLRLRADAHQAKWLAETAPLIAVYLEAQDDARWWIDNRDANFVQLAQREIGRKIRARDTTL